MYRALVVVNDVVNVVVNADLILNVGAGIKASSGFLDELLVFCRKWESDVFIVVKLVHSGTYIKT